jgi:hypothetical protein
MKHLSFLAVMVWLFLPAAALAQSQQTTDVELIRGANQQLAAAIGARDINAMDKVWAHEIYASFIGPLSTMVVVGWDGVHKDWQMRFGQFDRVKAQFPAVRTDMRWLEPAARHCDRDHGCLSGLDRRRITASPRGQRRPLGRRSRDKRAVR